MVVMVMGKVMVMVMVIGFLIISMMVIVMMVDNGDDNDYRDDDHLVQVQEQPPRYTNWRETFRSHRETWR